MAKQLGILLTTSPEHQNTHTIIQLALAALSGGVRVRIFLMCDGVYHVNSPKFLALADAGAELTLCAHNARERAVTDNGSCKIDFGSQYDLALIAHETDRFIAFN